MNLERRKLVLAIACAGAGVIAAACAGKGGTAVAPCVEVKVSGVVRDYKTGAPLAGAVLKSVDFVPELNAETASDGSFTFAEVPVNGFLIVQVSSVGHVSTINPAILVQEQDLTGVSLVALASADTDAWATGFGISPDMSKGQLVGRAQYDTGNGIAGVQSVQLLPVSFSASGPFFFDAAGAPSTSLTATSSNGGFTFMNVTTGNIAVQASATNFLFQPVASVSKPGSWSVVTLIGQGGTPGSTPTPTPTGTPAPVSFANQVLPIFQSAVPAGGGCSTCHKPPTNAGNMRLDQNAAKVYATITGLPGVVDTANPANSLILTKPLAGSGVTHGGNKIFPTNTDPRYLTIYDWIVQGAPNN